MISFGALLLCLQLCFASAFCQQAAQGNGDALEQARALAVSGKLQQAQTLLQQVLHSEPTSADAHFLLGYVYFREQHPRKSLAEFTSGARTRFPGVNDLRIVASDYVLLADYTDAAKWFSVVASEDQNNPDDWYLLGRAQYSENHFQQAITSFQRTLALRPDDVTAENNLGLCWQGMNEMAKAKQAFQTAIQWEGAAPNDPQPFLNMGTALINSGHTRQALPYLKTAVHLAPRNPKIREELARIYQTQKDLPQAQHQLEVAIALAPKAAGLHFELGRIYWREGLHDQAQKQFKICAQLNGSHGSVATPNPYTPR